MMFFKYFISLSFILAIFWANPLMAQEEFDSKGQKISIERYLELSKIKEQEGDKKEATRFLNQAASIHWENKEYEKAIEYYKKSLKLNQEIGNENGMMMINGNLGLIYSDMKEFDKALGHLEENLKGRRKLKEKMSIIAALINVSVVLNNLKRYSESAERLEQSLVLARELNDPDLLRSSFGMLSETYEKAGNAQKSHEYFELYRTFHQMVENEKVQKSAMAEAEAKAQSEILAMEKKLKEYELINKEKELVKVESDNQKLTANLTEQEVRMGYLKQQAEIKELQKKEEKMRSEAQLSEERFIRNIFLGAFVFVALIFVLLYRNYREKKKINWQLAQQNEEILAQQSKIMEQNEELESAFHNIQEKNTQLGAQNAEITEQQRLILLQKKDLEDSFHVIQEKNESITSSINYAQRIQKAMLNRKEDLPTLFADAFILFKPRDIVSGDFYWFSEYHNKIVVTAADCTGHGVPGAFMSMIGNELLNKIIKTFGITSPDLILQELHRGIKNALHQNDTLNRDGMDIALFVVDKKQKIMEFAGAKNPLIYIQNNELVQLKADKNAIGGLERIEGEEAMFSKIEVAVDVPTWVYVFSDGYQDQFGGPDDRKFMIRRMKELMLEIHQKPMSEQHNILDHTVEDWMKDTAQIDDILVIGVKIVL